MEDPLAGLLANRLKAGDSASSAVDILVADGEMNSLISRKVVFSECQTVVQLGDATIV
jgi:hypothetical protein